MKAPTVTIDQIQQDIELDEFLDGVDLSKQRGLKESIAQAMIDRIVSRTEAGDGVRIAANGQGRPVKLKSPYSDKYEKSLKFKAAGKSKGKVNMTLTGDMLAALDVVSTDGNTITIGLIDDSQIPKAYNHQVGDTVPERPWFGISKAEVNDILDSFADEIDSLRREDLPPEDTTGETTTLKAMDFLDEGLNSD